MLTHGASRCVTRLLEKANERAKGKFQVIYVRDLSQPQESDRCVKQLRDMGIPVAVIREAAVAHVMKLRRRVDMVFVGAEVVTQNGGIISRLGTLQVAQLAKNNQIPFYVCAETHKFYRHFPISQNDVAQNILDFTPTGDNDDQREEDLIDYTVSLLPGSLFLASTSSVPTPLIYLN